jgi:hypothetical protein
MKIIKSNIELLEKLRMTHATNNIRNIESSVNYNGVYLYYEGKKIYNCTSWRIFTESIYFGVFLKRQHYISTAERKIIPLHIILTKSYDTHNTLEYKYDDSENIYDNNNNLIFDRSDFNSKQGCEVILKSFKINKRRMSNARKLDF